MADEQVYLNDEKWNQCIHSLKEIAASILNNEMGLNDGSLEILAILYKLPYSICNDANFLIFHALSSETMHLPLAHVRNEWNESSLINADKELKEIEESFKNDIRTACKYLLIFDFDSFRAQLLAR